MKKDNITNRKKHINISIILVCLLLLFAVFPTAGCSSGISGDTDAGGGSEITEEYSELASPTEAESTELDTPIVTESSEPESSTATEPVETEPMIPETEFTEIDSGFDRAIVLYADMSLEDIYADVINGGWCIIESVTVDSGVERLSEFYANTLLKSHDKILLASIERKNDTDITGITLYELSYHGYFTYRECRKSGDTPLSEIKSKDYHYLTLSTAGKDGDSNEFKRALILSRHSPMTFSTFLSAMLGDTDILRYYGIDGFDLIANISYADYDNYFKGIVEN